MSFFLATVPTGTRLYHGRGGAEPVTSGLEWLAFEAEHATNFAIQICLRDDDQQHSSSTSGAQAMLTSHESAKWWLDQEHLLRLIRGGSNNVPKVMTRDPDCSCSPERSHEPERPGFRADEDDLQHILTTSQTRPKPSIPPEICVLPGYLHTYSPKSALRLVYIDGQSAAKSNLGTLASQDDILLRDSALRPNGSDVMPGELLRAYGLCSLANNEWSGLVDGFVRMEHGFEILLCDFDKVKFESAVSKNHTVLGSVDDTGPAFQFFKAIGEDRYWGIGTDRLKLETDEWASAYAVEDLDLWKKSIDGELPELSSVTDQIARGLREDIWETMVSHWGSDGSLEGKLRHIDWQAVADLYATRYANRLKYLMGINNAEKLRSAAENMLMVYLDHEDKTLQAGSRAINRCSNAFIPTHLIDNPAASQSMSQLAISTVALRICTAIYTIATKRSLDLQSQKELLLELSNYLRWPQWYFCSGRRACDVDEVCFTAIWPWGSQEDHDRPRCWNETGMRDRMGAEKSYWYQKEAEDQVGV